MFYPDHTINLYYLNELYQKIGRYISDLVSERFQTEIPITSGVWGGTYLIADAEGKSKRRLWRLYSIVNLPQDSPLDRQVNLEHFMGMYTDTFAEVFRAWDLDLELQMWGGQLPHSNKERPTITMHMEDSKEIVRWARSFFVWNEATWEQSVIHDLVRMVKEYKKYFDLNEEPVFRDPGDMKYMLQDMIIIYHTLRSACHEDFIAHADPIIQEVIEYFLKGLHDPMQISECYEKMFHGALIYGYEQAMEDPFKEDGLDIYNVENWPVEKINHVPESLQKKLIPPIQEIFQGFKTQLNIQG